MPVKSLSDVVRERPFPEYADWWPVGDRFIEFMADAITTEWKALHDNRGRLTTVETYTAQYLEIVYNRTPEPNLVEQFSTRPKTTPLKSGEFDALSYAFYRSAFELIADHADKYEHPVDREQRLFTKRVGTIFFGRIRDYLNLDLPAALETPHQLNQVTDCIEKVGTFLNEQGYLRSHFAFRFDVDIDHQGRKIRQDKADVITKLNNSETAHALYEMGYPIILPSAVYLYHTLGEAQHHSSRTIEDLFDAAGCDARETDDFDPIGYPSDMVVELWEIRRK